MNVLAKTKKHFPGPIRDQNGKVKRHLSSKHSWATGIHYFLVAQRSLTMICWNRWEQNTLPQPWATVKGPGCTCGKRSLLRIGWTRTTTLELRLLALLRVVMRHLSRIYSVDMETYVVFLYVCKPSGKMGGLDDDPSALCIREAHIWIVSRIDLQAGKFYRSPSFLQPDPDYPDKGRNGSRGKPVGMG
jgi:hypothetical protein